MENYQNRPVYRITATGTSTPRFDHIFKIRDVFESWVDTSNFLPLKHVRNSNEDGYVANEAYIFDYSKKLIHSVTYTSKRPLKVDSLKNSGCVADLLTSAFGVRNRDFSLLKKNEKIPLTIVVDNEIHYIYARFLGKEILTLPDKTRYRCNKFTALLVEGTIFKGGEDIQFWISDDDNKIPLMVEAQILIGSVKAYLKSAENLRHQTSSLVK